MSNDLTGPVWVVDEVGPVLTDTVRIERISWKNASTLNHTCRLVDNFGKLVFEDFASGSTYNTTEAVGRAVDGLKVETLQSGKLYITVAQRPQSF
jgi:hypothetical protein